MAKKKSTREPLVAAVTSERAARLFRLITLLGKGPQTRSGLAKRLKLGVRKFYRDLEVLRKVGIEVELSEGKYSLKDAAAKTLQRLPFPDPGLNLGEARQLAKGRSKAHKKIQQQIAKIEK